MQQVLNKRMTMILGAAGIVLGVLAYFVSLQTFLMTAAAALLIFVILWRVEIGIFLVVGFTPVLPTMAVLGLIIITLFSFAIRMFLDRSIRLKTAPIDLFIIAFAVVMLICSLASYTPKNSLVAFLMMAAFIAFYFVMTNTIKTKQQLFILVTLIVLTTCLISMYGIYQYKTGGASSESWTDQELFQDIKIRVTSTLGNPNVLGEYLVLILPLAISLLYAKKGAFYNSIIIAVAGIIMGCLLLTYSRGAWLGIILAMGLFIIYRDKRLLTVGILGALAAPLFMPASIINRFSSIGNLQDTSSSYRLSVWSGSLQIAKEYWLSGIGPGSEAFKLVYPRYSLNAAYAHHAHNVYIQLALEMGIVGLLVFLALLVVFFKMMLTRFKKSGDSFIASLMVASAAGLAGYLIQGMVDNIWYNNRVLLTFWVIISLGVCAYKLGLDKDKVAA